MGIPFEGSPFRVLKTPPSPGAAFRRERRDRRQSSRTERRFTNVHVRRIAVLLCGLLALASLAGAAAAPANAAADAGKVFPFPVSQQKLDNGLNVVVIPYDSPGTVAYYTVVRTGSRDEVEAGHSGFAHFFEHMMFRGTDKYSQDAYNDLLKRMGADSNAFTADDQTVYHMVGPAAE